MNQRGFFWSETSLFFFGVKSMRYTPVQFAIEGNSRSYTLGSFFEPVLNTSERKMDWKPAYNANQWTNCIRKTSDLVEDKRFNNVLLLGKMLQILAILEKLQRSFTSTVCPGTHIRFFFDFLRKFFSLGGAVACLKYFFLGRGVLWN